MPRAEIGSTKHIANQMKSKGLQRLRWYCQACARQMRDENGFKCHVASESHVRNMQLIGEDPRRAINDFSRQFERDFLQLLRTGHGEKKINLNRFYNEYIADKQHVHMNATKWASLTEFARYLGRSGVCRVEEDEKNGDRGGASGLTIAWIDNSPEALRRQETLRKKERQDKGDEERELRMIEEQIRRAKRDGLEGEVDDDEVDQAGDEENAEGIKRVNGEKVVLNFGAKKTQTQQPEASQPPTPPLTDKGSDSEEHAPPKEDTSTSAAPVPAEPTPQPTTTSQPPKISISLASSKPKNVFAAASKKSAFSSAKKPSAPAQQRPMSEAERIMKEEIERKRQREMGGNGGKGNVFKKQRVN
jgi:DNA/RNA-binding protein KIN17